MIIKLFLRLVTLNRRHQVTNWYMILSPLAFGGYIEAEYDFVSLAEQSTRIPRPSYILKV